MLVLALLPLPIDEVRERRAAVGEASVQGPANGAMEASNFGWIEGASRAQRVNSGAEERLVGVNVSDAGDRFLVEKHGLDRRTATSEEFRQASRGERPRQWLPAESLAEVVPVSAGRQESHAAELPLVRESQLVSVVEGQSEVFKAQRRL
jgi:hypothetical protein